MNSIFRDEKKVKTFVGTTFPRIVNDEVVIYMLVSRSKYAPEVKSSSLMIDYFSTNDVDAIIQHIKKACVIGDFYTDKNGKTIPPEACALYVNLSPKSAIRGYNLFVREHNELLYGIQVAGMNAINGNEMAKHELLKKVEQFTRVKTRLFSAIHKSASRKPYYLIDVDMKDEDILKRIIDMLDGNHLWISETRGGYHVIVKKGKEVGKIIWKEIMKYGAKLKENHDKDVIEIKSEPMTPVVGTLQGGFLVRRISI